MLFDVKYRRFKSNPNGEFIDLSSLREKPFAVKFVNKLTFDQHVKRLCKRGNAKLKALARFFPYMGLAKKKL